jgi:hypothetical protein
MNIVHFSSSLFFVVVYLKAVLRAVLRVLQVIASGV